MMLEQDKEVKPIHSKFCMIALHLPSFLSMAQAINLKLVSLAPYFRHSKTAMGWGGWGKGVGYHHHHHHHRQHHPIANAVAEAAVLGTAAIAGAAVASAVIAWWAEAVGGWKGKGKGKGHVTEVLHVPPLGVTAVGIPSSGILNYQGVTFFTIDVVPEIGASFRVQKRYNDFDALKDRLHRITPHAWINQDFPPKHLLSCDGPKVEDRRRGLESWLTRILNEPHSRGLWCLELGSFLEVGGIHTLTDMQPNLPVATAPESWKEKSCRSWCQSVWPADRTYLWLSDGRQLAFTVPAGVQAGSELQLWFDPTLGTLSPLVWEYCRSSAGNMVVLTCFICSSIFTLVAQGFCIEHDFPRKPSI